VVVGWCMFKCVTQTSLFVENTCPSPDQTNCFLFPEQELYEMLLAALAANAFIPATGDPFKV